MTECRRSEAFYVDGALLQSCTIKMKDENDAPESLVVLAPFRPAPKMDFGELRLGKTRTRRLRCQNPSNKSIVVSIENFPADDKGFKMDFLGPFSLGPKEDAILSLGWAPAHKGAIRETATLKYAPFKTIIQITGTCFDPQGEKQRKGPAPKNKAKAANPPFHPPPNPIQTLLGVSPPKVPIGEANVPRVTHCGRNQNVESSSSNEALVHFSRGREDQVTIITSSVQTEEEVKSEMFYSSRNHGFVIPKDVNHASQRRETFTVDSESPQVIPKEGERIPSFKDTFIVPAPPQRSTKSVLTEIKNLKSKLEESGVDRATKNEWSKTPSKRHQGLLNDIQTDIICSPSRNSSIINHLQVQSSNAHGYDFDLSSEDKENKPPRVRELFAQTRMDEEKTQGKSAYHDYETQIMYKEVVCTEEKVVEEIIYTEEQMVEEIIYMEEQMVEEVGYDYEIQVDGITRLMEEKPSEFGTYSSKVVVTKEKENDLSQEVFMSSTSDKVYSEKDLADVSLLVAQHLQEEEEDEQKMGINNGLENISISKEQMYLTPSEVNEGVKRFDFREESVYETNLHECKESFLQATINEHSFMPIPHKVHCSTAVKDKTKADVQPFFSTEKASILCKDLFPEEQVGSVQDTKYQVDIKTSILETEVEECQISSETYTKSPDVTRLNTINEMSEEMDFDSKCTSKILIPKSETLISAQKLNHVEQPQADGLVFVPLSETSTPSSDSVISLQGCNGQKKEENATTLGNSSMTTTKQRHRNGASHKNVSRSSPSKKESFLKRQSYNARNLKPTFKKNLTLIKMAAATSTKLDHDAAPLVRHPNLYSANNIYYDERWIEKQEKGFMKWLNFILTPWEEIFDTSSSDKKIDAAKLWSACSETINTRRAPTREVMSFRAYTAGKEMNNLRISACRLWQSAKVVNVITRLEIEIEKKRLHVRDDRCLNKDLGMKQGFLSLLLNYNPLWLRIGLETIYGEILHVTGNSDIIGISRFIITRLLSNPSISEEFIHPTVPHLYRPGYQEALKKFTLKKFLQLIYFLDYAKNNKLIKHNPCLFCKDADFKMSRDLLLDFSKKFLAGEGDVTKHLRYFGYDVSHKQTALDEFDFAVVNIPTDLRCGIRLCRVLELILDQELTCKVRVPAISRLQKIHNVNIALEALKSSPAGLPEEISSKDIVNGHMEKTLNLIWHIIFGLRLQTILSIEKWEKEIVLLRKSLKVHALMNHVASSGLKFVLQKEADDNHFETDVTAKYVLIWCRLVCAHYGVEIENLSVSFSDGRALCFLIHHYYPSFLPKEEIMMNTTVSCLSSTNEAMSLEKVRRMNEDLLRNEKNNFKLFLEKVNGLGGVPILIRSLDMSNTIPDRKVTLTFLAYFAARLLDLSCEINAARVIQIAWRRKKALKEKQLHKLRNRAAITIQRRVKIYLNNLRLKKYAVHVLTIQRYYRGYTDRKRVQAIRDRRKRVAAQSIQSWWKMIITRRQYSIEYKRICFIQASVRRFIERKRYLKMLKSVIFIQEKWRGSHRTLKVRNEFIQIKTTAVKLQRLYRVKIARQNFLNLRIATICIQSNWRTYLATKQIEKMKASVLLIQTHWRGVRELKKYQRFRTSAIIIQRGFRNYINRKKYQIENEKRLKLIIKIQACIRAKQARVHYEELKEKTIVIQSLIRRYLARKELRKLRTFSIRRQACIIIQSYFRGHIQRKKYNEIRSELKKVVMVQSMVRRFLAKQEWKRRKLEFIQVQACVVIQSYIRGYLQRRRFREMKEKLRKIVMVQSLIRLFLVKQELRRRKTLVVQNEACLVIQSYVRGYFQRKRYMLMKRDLKRIVIVQSLVRRYLAIQKFRKIKSKALQRKASTIIQSHIRGFLQRKKYLKLRTLVSKVIKIQSLVRRFLARREFNRQREAFTLRNQACLVIQSYVRGYLQRKKYRLMKRDLKRIVIVQSLVRRYLAIQKFRKIKSNALQRKASIIIQSHIRGYLQRKKYLKLRTKLLKVIKIQSLVRGFLARREFNRQREAFTLRNQACLVIQSYVRGYLQRKKYRLMKRDLKRIVIVQSLVRRYLAIQKFRKIKSNALQRKASTIIQSHIRGYLQRKRYLKLRTLVSKVIKIQSLVRGFLARREFNRQREAFTLRNQACLVIQSYVRGYLQRKKYMLMNRDLKRIVIVQSLVRRYLAIQKFRKIKSNALQRKSSTIIQSHIRGYLQRKKYLKLRTKLLKVIKIQSLVRGFLARREFNRQREAFTLRNQACLVIQSYVRGYLQRKKYMLMKRDLKRIVIVQSLVRRYLAIQKFRKIKSNALQRKASIIIQSHIRGYLQRKKYLKLRTKLLKVIKIQSLVRGFLARREFNRQREAFTLRNQACLVIQSYVRGYLQRKRCRLMKIEVGKIIKVQSMVRRFLAMKKRQRLVALDSTRFTKQFKFKDDINLAAICIQQNYRAWICRKKFKRAIRCAVLIQSMWRGYRTRKKLICNTRLSEVRARLVSANKEATENDKLCNRISYVLYHLYNIKSLAVLIKIVTDLDASTRYSEVCCDQMLENGDKKPVIVLLDLIGRCNKSVPHIEVISGVLNTLINLARNERTRLYISGLKETYKTCLETLQRFEKSHGVIFAKVISFLYVLTFEKAGLEGIKVQFTKKIKDYLMEYERKKHLQHKSGPKSKNVKGKKVIPHFPEWACTKEFKRHFEDPIWALKALLERLKL